MQAFIRRPAVIGIFIMAVHFPLFTAMAGTLENWQGSFVSQDAFLDSPAFESCFEKIVESAEKQGKSYTITTVKDFFKKVYHSDFTTMRITEDTITFYGGDFDKPIDTRRYRYVGERNARFGEKTITWHAFESVRGNNRKPEFNNIVLLEIMPEKKAVPHFHMRCGKESHEELVANETFQNWWPVYLYQDFDLEKLAASKNPEKLSRLLP